MAGGGLAGGVCPSGKREGKFHLDRQPGPPSRTSQYSESGLSAATVCTFPDPYPKGRAGIIPDMPEENSEAGTRPVKFKKTKHEAHYRKIAGRTCGLKEHPRGNRATERVIYARRDQTDGLGRGIGGQKPWQKEIESKADKFVQVAVTHRAGMGFGIRECPKEPEKKPGARHGVRKRTRKTR